MGVRQLLKKSDTVVGLYNDLKRARSIVTDRSRSAASPIENYLKAHAVKKLQIGAGPNSIEGWLGTDIEPETDQVAFLDASKPFPIEDTAFDYVFSEHMIEHIPWAEGQQMLRECYRILKPGGVVRIATPDLVVLLGLYQKDRSEQAKQYMDWIAERFLPDVTAHKPVFVINNAFRAWGHQFLYDSDVLEMAMTQAGFAGVVRCTVGNSAHNDLQNVESHGLAVDNVNANAFETMVFEGTRPK